MKIRDRVKELRRVKAKDLLPHPKNWRRHPKEQRAAMEAIFRDVGFAGALLTRETPEGLQILDGHLRSEIGDEEMVPVIVTDLDDHEAEELLATFDPISAMARADAAALKSLLEGIDSGEAAIQEMLESVAVEAGILPAVDYDKEWQGMPEFDQEDKTAFRTLIVHFKGQEEIDEFAKLVDQSITDATKYLWFPKEPVERYVDKEYVDES